VGQSLHVGTMRTRVFWQSIYNSDSSSIDEATSTDVNHSPHQVHMFTFVALTCSTLWASPT
jgi:hypothetical protein